MPAPLSSTICPRWGPGSSRRESNAYAGRGLKFGALSMESRDVADLRCRCFCGRCYGDPNDAAYDGTTTRPGRVGLVSHTESVSIDAPLDQFRDWANAPSSKTRGWSRRTRRASFIPRCCEGAGTQIRIVLALVGARVDSPG